MSLDKNDGLDQLLGANLETGLPLLLWPLRQQAHLPGTECPTFGPEDMLGAILMKSVLFCGGRQVLLVQRPAIPHGVVRLSRRHRRQ